MDDLNRIMLFRDLVDRQSFSATAQHWGLSHSTVSKHISALEHSLGVVLLRRTTRSMALTDEGRAVYASAGQLGQTMSQLQQRLEILRGEVSGELRISSMVHLAERLVQPAITRFLASYPQVSCRLVLDDGPCDLQQADIDLAVRVGETTVSGVSCKELCANNVVLVASPDFIAQHGEPTTPQQLAHFPTVAYASSEVTITNWPYLEDKQLQYIQIQPRLLVNDGFSLVQAVRASIGIGYVSAFAVQADLDAGRLVAVLPDCSLPPYTPIFTWCRQDMTRSPRITAFKNILAEQAQQVAA